LSNRTRILLIIVGLVALTALLRYGFGDLFAVKDPVVSVKAEPLFSIDGTGFHFGPAMFEGGHHPEGFVFTNAMALAVITTIVLLILSLLATRNMRMVPTGFQNFVEIVVDGMYNTFGSVDRKYIARFWPLVGTIFFYVLISNWLALVPGVLSIGYRVEESLLHGTEEASRGVLLASASGVDTAAPAAAEEGELVLVPYLRAPSADLNNTLMLGLVAFFFIEYWGFRQLGLGYLRKFWPLKDYGAVGAVVGPLELLSEFVRVVSFAFRLFGNIFAGEVILLVMAFLFPLLQLPFLGLEVFIGFIQAFVFAILVMAFASLATQAHGDHGEHDPSGHGTPSDVGGELRQNPAAH
jgi:F-type H+-transporting ATPase subunit a